MISKSNKFKKEIFSDLLYSLLATGIPIFTLQFILYPIMANYMGSTNYGTALTVIAGMNVIVAMLGNQLSYTRLLRNSVYLERGRVGDFRYLLIIAIILLPILLYTYLSLFLDQNFQLIITVIIISIAKIIGTYYATALRLNLDYRSILVYNIIASLGYLIGLLFIKIGYLWTYAFMTGEILSLLFIHHKSSFKNDPLVKTDLFDKTFTTYLMLILSSALSNSLQYFDKFLIFPTLGADSVSIYTVAGFFGKIISLAILPLSGVLLSYLASSKIILTIKNYYKLMSYVIFLSMLFLILSRSLSYPVVKILYPGIAEIAKEYIWLVNLGIVIGISSSISLTVALKIAPTYWQIIVSIISISGYLLLGYYLIDVYGLYGFTFTVIAVNAIKLLMTNGLAHFYIKKLT